MSIKSAKQKAWREFSKYIRLRDCLRTMNNPDKGMCITCGKVFDFKALQAGHFIAGRTNNILFDEDMVHAQCYKCNVCNHGEQLEYYFSLKKMGYTDDEITNMRKAKHIQKKYSEDDYNEIADKYKKKQAELTTCFNINGGYSPKISSLTSLPHAFSS